MTKEFEGVSQPGIMMQLSTQLPYEGPVDFEAAGVVEIDIQAPTRWVMGSR